MNWDPTGWAVGIVKGYFPRRQKHKYDVKWQGETDLYTCGLPLTLYSTDLTAEFGSWFIISKLPLNAKETVESMITTLVTSNADDVNIASIYAAMASHEAADKEDSDWPIGLTFCDFAEFAWEVHVATARQRVPKQA
jgi:hypothetical protein